MNLITLENINKSYGTRQLLKNVCLSVNEGEKLGLIGINGTGKSTLLKIISGISTYDSGNIIKSNSLSLSYLPQTAEFDDEATVLSQVFMGENKIFKIIRDYENMLSKLSIDPSNSTLQNLMLKATNEMDSVNAWEIESKAKTILTKLGITDFNHKIKGLSGGQKKRIALAESLINPGNLLLLDEPTNHLDSDAIKWLEDYLMAYTGAIIMITHDRYFLDRVTGKIIELFNGNLYSYEGNYSYFLESKLTREEQIKSSEEKMKSLLKKELAWIKKGAKARTTKQKARIKRFEELSSYESEDIGEKVQIESSFERLGKKVIELKNINKAFGEKLLIKDFSYIFKNGDKVGIIGPNGCGKSTLLNICMGNIKEDSGEVEIGSTVKFGYFSQVPENIDESQRVIDYIKEDTDPVFASKLLEKFLFTGDMQYSFINKLSGGEKRRLQLLKVLTASPNVLFLDEPTNDLDAETLTILEDYLEDFAGTIIIVSHDRYFLDKLCTSLICFEGSGDLKETFLSCSEYLDEKKLKDEDKEITKEKTLIKNTNSHEKVPRFTFKEKEEYEKIDELIENEEKKLSDINKEIEASLTDYVALEDLSAKKKDIEERLQYLMERWEYLNELQEKIESYKKSN